MSSNRRAKLLVRAVALSAVAVGVFFVARDSHGPEVARPGPVEGPPATYKSPLVISVETVYQGADAQTVANAVAAPIEQKVNGVKDMVWMSSRSAGDGTYKLKVGFRDGIDLDMAHALVQNRVALAMPEIPAAVQNRGVTVRKKSPDVLMFVNLWSPDNRYDDLYLSSYAAIQIKDELGQLPGAGDVVFWGQNESKVSVQLDPIKLAAAGLTTADVVHALAAQNIQIAVDKSPEPKDKETQLIRIMQSRLVEREQLELIIIRVTANSGIVRLKDVGRVDVDEVRHGFATVGGAPTLLIGVYPVPLANLRDLSASVLDKVKELRARLPEGLDLNVTFDFTANLTDSDNPATPEYLLLDVHLPDSASAERIVEALQRCGKAILETPGVQHAMVQFEHPFGESLILVSLAPADSRQSSRKQIAQTIRSRLSQDIRDAYCRVCEPRASGGYPFAGYPIDIAIEDRGDAGPTATRQMAEKLAEKLKKNNKLTDVWIDSSLSPIQRISIIERYNMHPTVGITANPAAGVTLSEACEAVEATSKELQMEKAYGLTWRHGVK
jgi:multidrug efflux pump subunit AcrB